MRRILDAELARAEQEQQNIKQAVRLGKATIPLLEMLEETEGQVQRLRTELNELETEPKAEDIAQVLPSLVEGYAHDLRTVLCKDVDRARVMLSNLLGVVTLRPEKDGLWAEMRGNLHTLLAGLDNVASVGAGSPFLTEFAPRVWRVKVAP